jgi:uncharacterized MnhB-related membrane protein
MNLLQLVIFALVAAGGTGVVLTRHPRRQALVLSFFGLLLTILFVVLRAPDVALSELAVGAAAVPLMLLVVISKVPKDQQ